MMIKYMFLSKELFISINTKHTDTVKITLMYHYFKVYFTWVIILHIILMLNEDTQINLV